MIHSSALSEQTNRKHSSKNGQVQTLDQKNNEKLASVQSKTVAQDHFKKKLTKVWRLGEKYREMRGDLRLLHTTAHYT